MPEFSTTPWSIPYLKPEEPADIPYIGQLSAARIGQLFSTIDPPTHAGQLSPVGATNPAANTIQTRRTWTATLTTDAAGIATTTMPVAAAAGILGVHVTLHEPAGGTAGPNIRVDWRPASSSLTQLSFRAIFCASAQPYATASVTVSITTVSW